MRCATAVPIAPRPTTSTCEPAMVRLPGDAPIVVLRPLALALAPERQRQPRNSASVTARTCSAMVSADMPREFVITTGLATISGNSMPPTPAAGL